MLRYRIRYLILLLLSFLLYIFYVGYTSYFIFVLVCALPVLSFILLLVGVLHLDVQVTSEKAQVTLGDTMTLLLHSVTKYAPLAQIQAEIQFDNCFMNTTSIQEIRFTAERKHSEVALPYVDEACGKIEVHMQYVYILDPLGLFRIRKKMKRKTSFFVMPNPIAQQEALPMHFQYGEERYVQYKPGNDPGETFDVHAYRAGDSIHKIHWKLSAKMDELMVRDFSMPLQDDLSVRFDLYGSVQDAQTILAHVYGFSFYLLECAHVHDVVQYAYGQELRKQRVETKAHIDAFLKQILSASPALHETSALPDITQMNSPIFFVKKDGVLMEKKGDGEDA